MGSEDSFKTVSNYNRDNWSAVGNRYEQIQDALTIIAPSVPELIFNRKQEGLGTNVLDLFGPGGKTGKAFMRQADSWTGVRLNDGPNTHSKIIKADLFNPIERDNIVLPNTPDVILCNPIGAFGLDHIRGLSIQDWSIFMQSFYDWAYTRLTSNEGVFVSELMYFIPDGFYYKEWPEYYRFMMGIYADGLTEQNVDINIPALENPELAIRSMVIKKYPESPSELPYIHIEI